MLDNQYTLTRFFAKSSVLPDQLYKTLNGLEESNFTRVKQVKYIKYYSLTDAGRQLLKEKYSLENLRLYLHNIEQTDFFINILEKISQRDK